MKTQRLTKYARITMAFHSTLRAEGIDATVEECRLMVDVSRRLQALAVNACNRELTETEDAHVAHFTTALHAYAKRLGIGSTAEGDPRGHVVKVHLPSGRSNHWGGATWAVLGS